MRVNEGQVNYFTRVQGHAKVTLVQNFGQEGPGNIMNSTAPPRSKYDCFVNTDAHALAPEQGEYSSDFLRNKSKC